MLGSALQFRGGSAAKFLFCLSGHLSARVHLPYRIVLNDLERGSKEKTPCQMVSVNVKMQ